MDLPSFEEIQEALRDFILAPVLEPLRSLTFACGYDELPGQRSSLVVAVGALDSEWVGRAITGASK